MEAEQVIEYQRAALLRLLLGLFSVAGLVPGGAGIASLPKPVRLVILRVLLPAESATRRLAYYLSLRLPALADRVASKTAKGQGKKSRKRGVRAPSFWLFDRRQFIPELSNGRRVARGPGPAIRFFDESARRADAVEEDAPIDREAEATRRLLRRMEALHRALNDMPAQARRLQRAMKKREAAPPGPKRYGPVRSGFPPGYRRSRPHEIDELLYECHLMACVDRPPPDVSAQS